MPAKKKTDSDPVAEMPYAKVRYGFGATIPTEAYANVRVDIQVELPALLTEIDGVYEFAADWVDNKMAEKYAEVKEAYGL